MVSLSKCKCIKPTIITTKTRTELLKEIESLEPEHCFAVIYDSFNGYKLWCGNQDYGFYENEILTRDDEILKLKKEVNRQNLLIDCLLKDLEK
ncbi:hypothetical protein [Bacillus thuringiensis]|uniref:hypothetical protein n=1 Tax=Bacillus thuringiensis TaxID=1428 RepID=UPI0021562D9B|nr:hypothetical protein [Bacillus thuringiensis]